MTHLVCSTCGYESWSWSALDPDPVAEDFARLHTAMGHVVVQKAERKPKAS